MKRKVRLTESDLHRVIKESINRVLNEDYDFNADFEDGGTIYDRERYGKSEEQIEDWERDMRLSDKIKKQDNYEFLRHQKMIGNEGYGFADNMLKKHLKQYPKDYLFKDKNEMFNELKECEESLVKCFNELKTIYDYHLFTFIHAYKKTGDERYLVAARQDMLMFYKSFENNVRNKIKNHDYSFFTIDTNSLLKYNRLKDYSPLSKDKVYDANYEDPYNYEYWNRPATIKDRKEKRNRR